MKNLARVIKVAILGIVTVTVSVITYIALDQRIPILVMLCLPGFVVSRIITGAHGGTQVEENVGLLLGILTNTVLAAGASRVILFALPTLLRLDMARTGSGAKEDDDHETADQR